MKLTDKQIMKAQGVGRLLSHPMRLEILAAVGKHGEASSTSLSKRDRLGSVQGVNYHVQELAKVGALRHERYQKVGPVTEKLYSLTPTGQSILVLVDEL